MRVGSERYAGVDMRICCALVLVTVGCAAQENTRSISGSVIDPTGALIPNTTVSLSGLTTVEVKTDNQGKFMFSTLESGSYKLKFDHAGFKPKTLDVAVHQEPILFHEVLLELLPQPCYGPVVFDNVLVECSGSICGAVRYGSAVVTNAIVFLQLSGESRREKTTRTDANGVFQFNIVKAGLYDLTIEAKGFKPATTDSIAVQRGGQITLPPVQLLRPTTPVR
jgi:Carboxypeptidase regulatory-like domain